MPATAPASRMLRFGAFELNVTTGELRKGGAILKLRPQAAKILGFLALRRGHTVTRDELREHIWGNSVFVDFEHGLNLRIRQIRAVLGDDANKPWYIETVPRCGYRFIAHVEELTPDHDTSPQVVHPAQVGPLPSDDGKTPKTLSTARARWAIAVSAATLLVAAGIALATLGGFHASLLRRTQPVDIQSIAVLPLANLSGDPTQDYFAEGMTDDLITHLAKASGLRVISRTSVMRYKGASVPLPEIGKDLNVSAVVEGSVARAGGRVRITAQLIEASTDRHLWADSYERDTRDILQLQDDVARDIASHVEAKLTARDGHPASARQVSPEAYDLYLKGRYLFNLRGRDNLNDSLAYFQQAVALEPNFAAAYAAIAQSYGILGNNGHVAAEEVYSKAKAAALKALELDPDLSDAHVALAEVVNDYEWNWPAAEQEYKRAIQLDRNNATAHHWYAMSLSWVGLSKEAIAEMEEARRLDPLSPRLVTNLASIFLFARQYDRAITESQKAIALEPKRPAPYYYLGAGYLYKGMYSEALAEMQKAVATNDNQRLFETWLAYGHAVAGDTRQALDVLKQVKEAGRRTWVSPTVIAAVYGALGHKDQAFAWLDKALAQRDPRLYIIREDPAFDPLRSDPRFAEVLRRRHLPI